MRTKSQEDQLQMRFLELYTQTMGYKWMQLYKCDKGRPQMQLQSHDKFRCFNGL